MRPQAGLSKGQFDHKFISSKHVKDSYPSYAH
jgi:hypothetical protein